MGGLKRLIYRMSHQDTGSVAELLRVEEATPVHGDLCAACGKCLHCDEDKVCCSTSTGIHIWEGWEKEEEK